ncbi:UNVERIFIED_ORG: hypothetical protein LHK14_21040 (plasmid) [Roseateles sp. XES5]|nr:hypothetical protein [Roseateles sp. XES5]
MRRLLRTVVLRMGGLGVAGHRGNVKDSLKFFFFFSLDSFICGRAKRELVKISTVFRV